jgi:uncharacterized protein
LFYRHSADGILLSVYLQPNAAKDQIVGQYEKSLKIKIAAPSVDGAANQALLKFLAKYFKLAKSNVVLVKGARSREKTVRLKNIVLTDFEDKIKKIRN